jgi:hypothetical protein
MYAIQASLVLSTESNNNGQYWMQAHRRHCALDEDNTIVALASLAHKHIEGRPHILVD